MKKSLFPSKEELFNIFEKKQGQEDLTRRQQFVVGLCFENMGKQQSNVTLKKRFWNPLLTTLVYVLISFDLVDFSFLTSKATAVFFSDKIRSISKNKDLPTQTQSVFQCILNNSFFQIFFAKKFGEKIDFPKMPEVLERFLKESVLKSPEEFLLS